MYIEITEHDKGLKTRKILLALSEILLVEQVENDKAKSTYNARITLNSGHEIETLETYDEIKNKLQVR